MQEKKKKDEQLGKIANIYDQMIKEIMPLPQKPTPMRAEGTETKPVEKSKEEEKKEQPIFVDSFT